MGTTLTGTTPQDTYDSLIKVTDNGPLSGTAKYLSDGLGNDSVLALSTARVGVGTTSPSVALHTNGVIRSANSGNTIYTEVQNDGLYATATDLYLLAPATKFLSLYAGGAEAMRLTSDLYVRLASGTGGIQFNGDTAAANALDDYEEGTFTPTFAPTSGAFASTTYSVQYGKYTKIGNRVDINIQVTLSSLSVGTAAGVISIGGLPFTVGAKPCPFAISLVLDWDTGKFPVNGFFNDGATNCLLRYVSALNANDAYIGGAEITNTSSITLSGTYFV